MKRVVLLLITIVCFCACTKEKEVKIKGVPFLSKYNDFVSGIKEVGFTEDRFCSSYSLLKGTFIGQEANICVHLSHTNDSIKYVHITFGDIRIWKDLQSMYNDVVEMYIKKYGKPIEKISRFNYPYSDGDGREIEAIRSENAIFKTIFKCKDCYILIIIDAFDDLGYVVIDYMSEFEWEGYKKRNEQKENKINKRQIDDI